MNEKSLATAIKGSNFVVHVASPIGGGDCIKPAVNGTMAVMRACHANRVSRLVITSSIAACQNLAKADKPANRTFNENHWSNPDRPEGLGGYFKGKTLAEKAAWDFHAALPD